MSGSKLEQMAYKMEPAGHEEPPRRRKYTEPSKELSEAFEKWLDSIRPDEDLLPLYNRAENAVRDIDATVEEVHALLLAYQNYPKVDVAGLFASAIYNKRPEKIINFDIDLDFLTLTGYNLPQEKTLIATVKSAHWLGEKSKGTILNYSPGLLETGMLSSGLVINYSQSNDPDFTKKSAGIGINLGKIRNFNIMGRTGYLIDFSQDDKDDRVERKVLCEDVLRDRLIVGEKHIERNNFIIEHMMTHEHKMIPELWEYLQQLKHLLEPGKDDYKKALIAIETLGPEPVKKIKTVIDEMFRRKGYDV